MVQIIQNTHGNVL